MKSDEIWFLLLPYLKYIHVIEYSCQQVQDTALIGAKSSTEDITNNTN